MSRAEDHVWQSNIITKLQIKFPEHALSLSEDIGSPRFRPEEVAGAAASQNYPVSFDLAYTMGIEILRHLNGSATPNQDAAGEPFPSTTTQ